MNVTKKDLSKKIASEVSISYKDSNTLLNLFIDKIISSAQNGKVKLSGFGSFVYKFTPQRVGRNPKNKKAYQISERYKLSFLTSSHVKEILN